MTQGETNRRMYTKVIPETTQLYQHAAGTVGFLWQFPSCSQTCPRVCLAVNQLVFGLLVQWRNYQQIILLSLY